MKDCLRVIAVSYGSEFSLGPLCDALEARGIPCTRIDMFEDGWRERDRPDGREVVLLSSQHPSFGTSGYFSRHHGIDADIPNLTEAIAFFSPARTFLLPHDLTNPFHDEETPPLREVTGVLVPDERFWYLSRWCPVHVVGWPKLLHLPDLAAASGIVFLPTDVSTFTQRGLDAFKHAFAGLMSPGVRFKLPVFRGLEPIRALLVEGGCEEIRATENSADVIAQHATIISNSLSSIVLEAALVGKDVICVQCGMHTVEEQWHAFSSYPNVELVEPSNLASALSSVRRGKSYSAALLPLNIDVIISLILGVEH